jgi:hypothetical protein
LIVQRLWARAGALIDLLLELIEGGLAEGSIRRAYALDGDT